MNVDGPPVDGIILLATLKRSFVDEWEPSFCFRNQQGVASATASADVGWTTRGEGEGRDMKACGHRDNRTLFPSIPPRFSFVSHETKAWSAYIPLPSNPPSPMARSRSSINSLNSVFAPGA